MNAIKEINEDDDVVEVVKNSIQANMDTVTPLPALQQANLYFQLLKMFHGKYEEHFELPEKRSNDFVYPALYAGLEKLREAEWMTIWSRYIGQRNILKKRGRIFLSDELWEEKKQT